MVEYIITVETTARVRSVKRAVRDGGGGDYDTDNRY